MSFRIDLDIFRGPLDLLLYLVRKHELEIVEIPVAPITEQFLEYLALLEQLDVNAVGDFLEMASTLLELKSRMILPQGDVVEEPLDDPRNDLVHRLLEYKQFKDAASMLDERARDWQARFPRLANDMAGFKRDLADEPIRELELWDLVSAFGRLIEQHQSNQPSNIVYDDTPIHVYMERIGHLLDDQPRVAFTELFQPGMHKSTLIGMFLAILELVRHHGMCRAKRTFGEIWLLRDAVDTAARTSQAPDRCPVRRASCRRFDLV